MGIMHGIAVFRVIIWGMKIHNYQLFWCEGHGTMGYKEVHVRWIEFDFRCCRCYRLRARWPHHWSFEIETSRLSWLRWFFQENIFYSLIGHCHAMWLPCVPPKKSGGHLFLSDGFPMIPPLSAEADGGAHGQVAGSSLSSSLHGLRRTATFSFHHFSTAF